MNEWGGVRPLFRMKDKVTMRGRAGEWGSGQAKEPLDGRQNPFRLVRWRGGVGLSRQALTALGHNEAKRLHKVRICIEYAFHCCMTNLEDFGFFQRNNIRGSRLASE